MGGNLQNRKRGADPTFPRLLGERLCLDFVNTIESPLGAHPEDFLRGYPDLAQWARHVGLLDDAATARLLDEGARRPDAAAEVFRRAVDLRAALTRIFRAVAHGETPAASDLARLQEAYLAALARARLAPTEWGYDWAWAEPANALEQPLWAVTRSAVEVLTTDEPARIKQCPGANGCGWLFYDTSKNGSRRWCSMEGCGSRVKMRQHYARRHARSATSST